MLGRIHIKGYRSCRDVRLNALGPLTALIGPNGSGKTNLLQAIARFASIATSLEGVGIWLNPFSFQADLNLAGQLLRYTLSEQRAGSHRLTVLKESLRSIDEHSEGTVLFSREGARLEVAGRNEPIALPPRTPGLLAILSLLPNEAEVVQPIRALVDFLRSVRYDPCEELSKPAGVDSQPFLRFAEYQLWREEFAQHRRPPDSVLLRLVFLFNEQRPLFNAVVGLFDSRGLNLFREIRVVTQHDPILYSVEFFPGPVLGGGERACGFSELSLGTRRILRMLLSLVFGGSSLLLLEHPEDGLHPGLLRKVIGLIRVHADPVQVLLTSHSPTVINTLRPGDLRLVANREGSTTVRSLQKGEIQRAEAYLDDEGTLEEFVHSLGE